jgi:hypothetical protein
MLRRMQEQKILRRGKVEAHPIEPHNRTQKKVCSDVSHRKAETREKFVKKYFP